MEKECKHSPMIFVDANMVKCEQCGYERESTEREKSLYRAFLRSRFIKDGE